MRVRLREMNPCDIHTVPSSYFPGKGTNVKLSGRRVFFGDQARGFRGTLTLRQVSVIVFA